MFGFQVDTNTGGCKVQESTTTTDTTTSNTGTSTSGGSSTSTSNTNNSSGTSSTTPTTPPIVMITCPEGFYLTPAALYIYSSAATAITTLATNLTAATACAGCPPGCTQCKWNPDLKIPFCFACLNEFDYFLSNEKGVCLSKQCPNATIFNPSLGCEKCPDKCKACERTSTGELACVECMTGFKPDTTGICVFDPASCPTKWMSVGTYCKPCPELCSACSFSTATNQTSCSGCVTGYTPSSSGQCIKECPAGKYFGPGGNLGLQDCYSCPFGCTGCKFDTAKYIVCTECNKTINFTLNSTTGKCSPPPVVITNSSTSTNTNPNTNNSGTTTTTT